MKAYTDENRKNWLVRLDLEEEIIGTLSSFLEKENISSGRIQGIGAVKDPVLGFFSTETNTYDKKTFPGEWELISLLGNITLKEKKPFPHLHITISGEDYLAYGGHLFSGIIAVTGEIYIQTLSVPIARQTDPKTGLYLMA